MTAPPDVSVIIVTWNSRPHLPACLRSVAAAVGTWRGEILVVDNASADGTAEAAEAMATELDNLTVTRAERNLGFAAGCNLALRQSTGRYLLLLNPDTQLGSGAIAALLSCARQHGAAIVGARHLNADGTLQPSVRRLPTLGAMVFLLLKLHRILPRAAMWQRYLAADFDYAKTQPAQQPAGSCLLVERATLERIGLLDERFYLWFEDVDWCRRARDAGLAIWYCDEATVTHHGGRSFGQLTTLKLQRQFNRSLRYYFKKHHGMSAWVTLACLSPISLALATVAGWITRHPMTREKKRLRV